MTERQAEIGRRFVRARRRAGLTQERAAEALGLNRSSLAGWETGRHLPKGKHLLALAGLYQTTPNELLGAPTQAQFPENLVEVPIVGRIPGPVAFTEAATEGFRVLKRNGLTSGVHYALRVGDDSMWPRFHVGDYAIVQLREEVEDGGLAIVTVDGVSMMRRVSVRGDMIALSCDHPLPGHANPVLLPLEDVRIEGKVVRVEGAVT